VQRSAQSDIYSSLNYSPVVSARCQPPHPDFSSTLSYRFAQGAAITRPEHDAREVVSVQ
jgi:hypothetical protein